MEIKAPHRDSLDFITHGRVRCRILGEEPVVEMPSVSVAPLENTRFQGFYFRKDENNKTQLCVVFPSGATQILATEE